MKKMMSIMIPAALLALLLGPAAREAEAGFAETPNAGCTTRKDGSGLCWGSLREFRQSPSAAARASFDLHWDSKGVRYRVFRAYFSNADHGCDMADGVVSDEVWAQLMTNPNLYFTIEWGNPTIGDGGCRVKALRYESGRL